MSDFYFYIFAIIVIIVAVLILKRIVTCLFRTSFTLIIVAFLAWVYLTFFN